MDSKPHPLHILFCPHLAHGHLIPTTDMARLFARQGVKATIVTTQLNAPFFSQIIERERKLGIEIDIHIIKFPSAEAGLPEGIENISSITSREMGLKFFKAVSLLQQPLEQILEECHPNCLVADAMFPWATEVARKLGIPRLVFNGTSYFALSVIDSLLRYEPWKNITSDYQPFEVPGIPGKIKMTKLQQPVELRESIVDDKMKVLMHQVLESEITSYGVLMNSFQELEPAYVEYYRNIVGRKTWHIGPLSLCNRNTEDISQRGNAASIDAVECLRWLDSKKHNSVFYICFGSVSWFSAAQLNEIAKGLEASGQDFIWVVRKVNNEDEEEWLPEGFEERLKGKGLIIRGWAPQVLILDHEAVGGFMTHCGWNSTLESITAGVPMVTWPLSNEQFYNEKLVTEILRVGIGVGAQEWSRWMEKRKFLVTKENIIKAVTQLMVGEEANDIRSRASALKLMAKRAVEEGGSSHSDLKALLDGLRLNSPGGEQ
ncbi:scopoletin glucosyltransferase-like [Durio zibethinus]|uniref:Glycosyltransferase n=1 Tax=Durio zibethinus TaxID=66656 RepID=A0A6P6AC30_DURZI|nr:scopoletin glucosyltransferase-like [Durio zibethinus]